MTHWIVGMTNHLQGEDHVIIMLLDLQGGDIQGHLKVTGGQLKDIQGHLEVMESHMIGGYLLNLRSIRTMLLEIVGVKLYLTLTQSRIERLDIPKIMTVGEGRNQGQIEGPGHWNVTGDHRMTGKVTSVAEVVGRGHQVLQANYMNVNIIKDIHDHHHIPEAEIEGQGHSTDMIHMTNIPIMDQGLMKDHWKVHFHVDITLERCLHMEAIGGLHPGPPPLTGPTDLGPLARGDIPLG